MRGWYASYWNTFSFCNSFCLIPTEEKVIFSKACVSHSVQGGVYQYAIGQGVGIPAYNWAVGCITWGATGGGVHPSMQLGRGGVTAVGTHPTGLHTLIFFSILLPLLLGVIRSLVGLINLCPLFGTSRYFN